ncbi:MAG: U32 family peptidase [Bacillales bacterium]|nr:U32 family peptidase [Bacillales bacterium]
MSLNERSQHDKYEILAPAGDKDSLIAAINNNADAVYLGLDDFNARVKAENFSKDNIGEIVRYAHLFGVKVYVTINILIKENEYPSLIEVIRACVKAKVDAYIIQDLGVARLIRECFKGAVLHASTQMGVSSLRGALVLQKEGFTRVVLARETKESEIRLIKEHTSLEIEYFVHGALCVSYSGNCYLSSFNHLQSGNRGRCLQLCRLKYGCSASKKGYLLSARDLCLLEQMERLLDAGVTSFKIEGRLKREGYVGLVTSTYASLLDAIKNKKEFNIPNAKNDLKEAFCRGDFSYSAYLDKGVPSSIIETKYQNHTGVKVGKVIEVRKFKDIFQIDVFSSHQIRQGDGLKFFTHGQEVGSLGVGNVEIIGNKKYRLYSKNKVDINSDVHLILNEEKEEKILNTIRRLPLEVNVKAYLDQPLEISFKYNEQEISARSDYILPKAKSKSISKQDLLRNIDKFDKEPFFIKEFECDIDDVFVPLSVINDTRRKAVSLIKEKIISFEEKNINVRIDESAIANFLQNKEVSFKEDKRIIIIDNNIDIASIKKIDDFSSYIVFISDNTFNAKHLCKRIEELKKEHVSHIGINVPLIVEESDYKELDKVVEKYPYIYLLASNIGVLSYIDKGIKVIASCYLNIISSYAKASYYHLGVSGVMMSLETSKNILDINKDTYYYSLGYNTLMNFAHCPYKTVYNNECSSCRFDDKLKYQDEKNTYTMRRISSSTCRFEMLSSHLLNTLFKTKNKICVDLRGLHEDEIMRVIESLNTSSSLQITPLEYVGLLNKEIK